MITTIGKLFNIEYGQKIYHNKEWLDGNEGNNILISSKGEDYGIYGFFNIDNFYKAPILTAPSTGTVGQAFVQERDCSVDDNCLALIPKNKLSKEELFQVAYQIRLNKWKYKYGRQITPERLSAQKIVLKTLDKNLTKFEEKIMPPNIKKTKINKTSGTKLFKIKDLFFVNKGQGSYLEQLEDGDTPIVSTQVSNNGICGFYDIEPTSKQFCITVGRIMCNPNVQLYDFATVPDDMFVLIAKNKQPKELLFYVSSIIKTEVWRFNYSRKVTKAKLEELDMPLPFKDDGIDYDYIHNLAKNSYGYNEL